MLDILSVTFVGKKSSLRPLLCRRSHLKSILQRAPYCSFLSIHFCREEKSPNNAIRGGPRGFGLNALKLCNFNTPQGTPGKPDHRVNIPRCSRPQGKLKSTKTISSKDSLAGRRVGPTFQPSTSLVLRVSCLLGGIRVYCQLPVPFTSQHGLVRFFVSKYL